MTPVSGPETLVVKKSLLVAGMKATNTLYTNLHFKIFYAYYILSLEYIVIHSSKKGLQYPNQRVYRPDGFSYSNSEFILTFPEA